MNEQLKKRLKSLGWRAGCMAIVAALNEIAAQLGTFDLSPFVITVVGLVVGELTKFVANQTTLFGNALKK